jgi:hypothetical protein
MGAETKTPLLSNEKRGWRMEMAYRALRAVAYGAVNKPIPSDTRWKVKVFAPAAYQVRGKRAMGIS